MDPWRTLKGPSAYSWAGGPHRRERTMDEIRCEVEVREVEGKPSHLVGVLMPYGERAKDRAEVFEAGSLTWDQGGVVLRRQHSRQHPILKFTPVERDGVLTVDAAIPSTAAGADCEAEIRSGLLTGLSVEFRSIRERYIGGLRRIAKAHLSGAGLVDFASYSQATVEARAKAERERWREYIL